jgi:diguanylate cyclase (GGDEF)-like protein
METELTALLDNAGQGFLTVDRSLVIQKPHSAECRRIFGRKIGGLSLTELLWPEDADIRTKVERLLRRMLDAKAGDHAVGFTDGLPSSFERGGMRIRIDYKRIGLPGEAAEPRIMVILTDNTEQYKSREQLEFLSTHDPLTGMFNRNYVDKWLSEFRSRPFASLSMIIADMNGLKLVNDVFGHLKGDELLTRAGGVIRRTFGDDAVCARWGGDEFLVLLPGTEEAACAEKIRELREACANTEASPIQLSMAVGTATMKHPLEDETQLFHRAEKEMYKTKLVESRKVRKKLIQVMTEAMYEQGIEDPSHIERVTRLAEGLAERLRISPQSSQMATLGLLARLHDVGKIAIPLEVFRHGGGLDETQWEIVRTHSEIGYRLAFSLGEPALAEAILSVHERWDGSGYPYGLREEQIPELSRLIALVDAYDVMTHDRPYRRAMSSDAALDEIGKSAGKQFDPVMAEAFVAWIQMVAMNERQYRVFENFLQYGDLRNAHYVFVGMEEGLGRESLGTVLESRYRWARLAGQSGSFVEGFAQSKPSAELAECFYVNDLDLAAWDVTKNTFQHDRDRYLKQLKIDGVMRYQSRMICLLRSRFAFLLASREERKKAVRACFFDALHKPDSKTAMIDRYPLPKQTSFNYRFEGLPFKSYRQYIEYNNRPNSRRNRIIRELYDTCPMTVTIGYAGMERGEFRLRSFYEQILDMRFAAYTTREVPEAYRDTIVPPHRGKTFLAGKRIRPSDGHEQIVVLTPFLGVGQISDADVDVIAAWIANMEAARER